MNRSPADKKARPYQLVLSDSLSSLRQQYDHRLSSEILRMINRRLIDLSDGLIVEFILGERRKAIIDRAVWDVIRWVPGAELIYQGLLAIGIDLKHIAGEADTANQAQIQSTKHPVSPMDIHLQTMQPRSDQTPPAAAVNAHQGLGLVALNNQEISIAINRAAPGLSPAVHEIRLSAGAGKDRGTLVDAPKYRQTGKFIGVLQQIDGEEHFVVSNRLQDYEIRIPTVYLEEPQRLFLYRHLPRAANQSIVEVA